ncbi:MAG: ABC transporter permease [Chitinophagales bacterium]|nr:ABC transporter permease [Chitinophagales bacterium]
MFFREVFRQMYDIGIGSFGIISIVSLFIGAVTSVQFGNKLMNLGIIPMWWMGGMVRDTVILEMAPTITGLLLAGKVGSNIASEIGTMRISEQIDAMEIMGVNTYSFLIAPKVLGAVLIVPALTTLGMFIGIIGGMISGVLGGYFGQDEYIYGLQDDFNGRYMLIMFIKSFVFPFLISSIASFKGYYVKGGALELGKSSTDAVVLSSIAIVFFNFFIAYFLL